MDTSRSSATVFATKVPLVRRDRSTNHISRASVASNWAASSSAIRVLPAPPDPVMVTSRCCRKSLAIATSSSSRPTNDVSGTGRLFAETVDGATREARPRPRSAAVSNSARSSPESCRASARSATLSRYGARRDPRSSAPIADVLSRANSASVSWEKPRATRCCLRSSPKEATARPLLSAGSLWTAQVRSWHLTGWLTGGTFRETIAGRASFLGSEAAAAPWLSATRIAAILAPDGRSRSCGTSRR